MDLFVAGKQCDYTKMRTQDDRKLVRLMWVYDVYFAWSLKQIVEQNYIEDIINNLVQDVKNDARYYSFAQLYPRKNYKRKIFGKVKADK